MRNYTLFILFIFGFINIFSQEVIESQEDYWKGSTEIGLDFTPLISSVIPFNLSSFEDQIVGFRYKRYYKKYAFKTNLGIDLNERNDRNFFHFSVGYERRVPLKKKFYYTTGWMFGLTLDDVNGGEEIAGLYAGHFYGIEYHFTERFFISTEAQLYTVFGDGLKIKFQAPVSIFAFVRI